MFIRKTAKSTITYVVSNSDAMKTKKSLGLAMLSALTAMILFSPTALAAPQPTSLNLNIQGIITNGGSQFYTFSGGTVVGGEILGTDVSGSNINYQVTAFVHGLSTGGQGTIMVSGSNSGQGNGDDHDHSWNSGTMVTIRINGETPAAIFPLDQYANNCNPNAAKCTSEIPLLFTGTAAISSSGQRVTVPVAIESPYWNPFGGPIMIASLDSATAPSLYLVVTSKSAAILWSGVVLQGIMTGTYGSETVSGAYQTKSTSTENLVSGTEYDFGSMTFASMSDSALNAMGGFAGKTTIATAGSFDCAPILGLPEGTCTATGASSSGSFFLSAGHGHFIKGTYDTAWSVPSLTTMTTATATVS